MNFQQNEMEHLIFILRKRIGIYYKRIIKPIKL